MILTTTKDTRIMANFSQTKSLERLSRNEAQLLNYLRLVDLWLGLLINSNVPILKHGTRRIVNG
ncbi:MAG: hypothetical protein DMG06_03065 [Acidobacteria bacterium]|nr:MAG: hypothetical protein DMG06_03065 [Acidobacteriota bacterium]